MTPCSIVVGYRRFEGSRCPKSSEAAVSRHSTTHFTIMKASDLALINMLTLIRLAREGLIVGERVNYLHSKKTKYNGKRLLYCPQ